MARRGQPRLTPNRHGRHGRRRQPSHGHICVRDVHYRKGFRHHALREMCTATTVLDPTCLKVTELAPTAPVYPSKPYSPVLDGCGAGFPVRGCGLDSPDPAPGVSSLVRGLGVGLR
jgi:hypothetical protein